MTEKGRLIAVVPMRLASAPHRALPPRAASEEFEAVAQQALAWQETASMASYWEMGSRGNADPNNAGRVYAFAGQIAAAGEQLALAHGAAVEVAIWEEVRAGSKLDASYEMSMRALAEAQCLFVIGTGHALINVVARALAMKAELRDRLGHAFVRDGHNPTFEAFSNDRNDWLSLNRSTCSRLDKAAADQPKEVTAMISPMVAFVTGTAWKTIVERRGQDFHRWRPQSDGIEGVPRSNPWQQVPGGRSLNSSVGPYTDGTGLADEVAEIANAAMFKLAATMCATRGAWPAASGHLGGPKFSLKEGS